MKKVLLPVMALFMAVGLQAQNFDRLPNEKMPPSQATVKKTPAKATSGITPTDNQMWWGYFSENDRANINYGYGQAATIDAFIYVPAGTEMVSASTIRAIRMWFDSDISMATDFKVWISRTKPEDISTVDYAQSVNVSSLSGGVNEIMLNTPFSVSGTDVYVGYTVSISDGAYFVSACDTPTPNAMFYRNSSDNEIRDYSDDRLALQILIEGGSYPTNCAEVEDFGQGVVLKGQSTTIPVTIINKGKNPIESISYVITTMGSSFSAGETRRTISPLAFNGQMTVDVIFDSDEEAMKYDKIVTITKVNDEPNNYSKNYATGSLITVISSPVSLPVVEEFTGTWCGYCPSGTVGMQKLHEKYGDYVAQIAVHSGDVMSISAYSPVENKYADGYPSASINREVNNVYPSANSLIYTVERAFDRPTVGTIELSAKWADETKTSVQFDTKTKFVYNDTYGNYGIAFVLVEDGLKGEGSQWNQANYFSGESGDSDMSFWYNAGSYVSGLEYNHVAVAGWDLLNGINGSVNTTITADEVQEYSFIGDLKLFTGIQDKSNLTAIALLINRESGVIVNAAKVNLGEANKPLKGDVNEDGKVDVADIATIIDIMAGKE